MGDQRVAEPLRLDRTRLVEYKKGEILYRQGEQAEGFYIVSTGRLRVFTRVEGREETVTVLHNGDSFGEMSLLEDLPRTASAFPAGERFLALMQQAGTFGARASHPLTFGTAFVYVGFVERSTF